MFYEDGVNARQYKKLDCLAAIYLYECWPVPEWELICGIFACAIRDITATNRGLIYRGIRRKEFTFWDTYDWLVEFTPRIARKCGADVNTVCELLLFEYDDEFMYDFFPFYGLDPL